MAESYRERAERGAALLDKLMPSWFKKVDLDTLKLSSCTDCVCGQIARKSALPYFRQARREGDGFAYWTTGFGWIKRKLGQRQFDGNTIEEAKQLGFVADSDQGYTILDKEWGRIVRERLEAEARS